MDQTLRAMLGALHGAKEDGEAFVFPEECDVTVHAGRTGNVFSILHVVRVTPKQGFVVIENAKHQRTVLAVDELRGFASEPGSDNSKTPGRKAGFV